MLPALAALSVPACGDDPTRPEDVAAVTFVYRAATTTDPAVAAAHPACVNGVGHTHIHPSWLGFARVDMTPAAADRWEITFPSVPVGDRRIRVSDPNVCADNATGAATVGVSANGTALTRIVDTPGSGVEPGLAFVLEADGTVLP